WAADGVAAATVSASDRTESSRKLEKRVRIIYTLLYRDWNDRRLRRFHERFQRQKHGASPRPSAAVN
ncbi:hypothetical protein ABTH26_20175, partial [Acinetobacter baumannii]